MFAALASAVPAIIKGAGTAASIGSGALSFLGPLLGGGGKTGFKPAEYKYETGMLNPTIFRNLQAAMRGTPTAEDWTSQNALMNQIRENYLQSRRANMSNYGARGVYDSGWRKQREGELLAGRAGQESGAAAQTWQNILQRQMQAQQIAQQYLANARAGSGRYYY